jgi:putative tryptophan/tyrosine transport system substrate-binding protein
VGYQQNAGHRSLMRRRRDFIALLGGTISWPLTSRAQTPNRHRIAFLVTGTPLIGQPYIETFRQDLRALGYSDDDLAIEARFAEAHVERLPDLAAELVRTVPEVIVTGTNAASLAAKRATSTIPIVLSGIGDPVGAGLVASLARPGGNVTGLTASVSYEMTGKWLELLKGALPDVARFAILLNPGNPTHGSVLKVARQAARTLSVDLLPVEAGAASAIDGAFTTMIGEHANALVVPPDALFLSERSRIVELATRHRLPTIYQYREYVAIGGLMSYGANQRDINRRAAAYVDKILKGASPADLPIEQPTKFELVINLSTARALDFTIPPLLLARADEVIE